MSAKLLKATAALLAQGFTHEQAAALLAANPVAPTTRNPDSPAAVRQRVKRANLTRTSSEQVAPTPAQGSPAIRLENTGKIGDSTGLALALARPVSEKIFSSSGISGEKKKEISALPSETARGAVTLFEPETLEPTGTQPVQAVWGAYLAARSLRLGAVGGVEPVLTPKRRTLIASRLKDHPLPQLVAAVTNVWTSDFHVQNGHTGIDLVLRDADKVERFAALADVAVPKDPDAWTAAEKASFAEWAKTHPPVPLTFPLARVPDLSVPNVVDEDMIALAAEMRRDPHELCAEMETYRLRANGEPS